MTVADDVNQTGRNFHLASIQFSTSKSDVLMRLTVLDNNDEVVSIEGKGNLVLPAFLFMRDVNNSANNAAPAPTTTAQTSSRPTSKTGGSSIECIKLSKKQKNFFSFKVRLKRMVLRLQVPILIEEVYMNRL